MMQELDDRLQEQIDKLEHVRLGAVELKDNLSGVRPTCTTRHICNQNDFFNQKQISLVISSIWTFISRETEQQRSHPVHRRPP